ncbi:MAG: hypothetical protein J7L77_06710 [Clostridiales bacterium]|nr:hypothetical protein [Clostridiales bacterium]
MTNKEVRDFLNIDLLNRLYIEDTYEKARLQRGAQLCVTHYSACECRENDYQQLIDELLNVIARLKCENDRLKHGRLLDKYIDEGKEKGD